MYKMIQGTGRGNDTIFAVDVGSISSQAMNVLSSFCKDESSTRRHPAPRPLIAGCSGQSWAHYILHIFLELKMWDSEIAQWNLSCTYNSTYESGIEGKYIFHICGKESQSIKREEWRQVSLKKKKKKISLFSDNLLYGYSFFPC